MIVTNTKQVVPATYFQEWKREHDARGALANELDAERRRLDRERDDDVQRAWAAYQDALRRRAS